ncbi:MAG: Mov34/MPN/PAD-1 family protein [Anaerolineales bacterium]|nr:Mov34/MPN/PAD-1 family protein [Anaerolineales bacterium]
MDKFWIEKARQYILTHCAFSDVSDIQYSDDLKTALISAIVNVNLPAVYIEKGTTDLGVENSELVRFVFSDKFPLEAPRILLRDGFPRGFPHINPNKEEVCPCIFEGSPSELLQQAEWMNGLLNQLVDWLEKAASNSLLNYEQGWEPMRNDELAGFMSYNIDEATKQLHTSNSACKVTRYEKRNQLIITDELCSPNNTREAQSLFCVPPTRVPICTYTHNHISMLSELYVYANDVGLSDLRDMVEQQDRAFLNQDILFVILAIPRPCKLIGLSSTWEFLNFVIYKSPHRKKKKRVLPESKVGMLSHINSKSPALLKKLSGSMHKLDCKENIAMVGCGSLGSKMALHLARNGNQPFLCIDDDVFLPHNNARHALSLTWVQNKAEMLAMALFSISGQPATTAKNAIPADYSGTRMLIDSTASHVVRSFLMEPKELPPIISTGLYDRGKTGILLIENQTRDARLCDLWAHLYFISIKHQEIREMLFSSQQEQISIGQSCSSNTLVMSDAAISLYAASFSLRIQKIIEDGFPQMGELFFMKQGDCGTLSAEQFDVPDSIIVRSLLSKNWQTRLSSEVEKRMRKLSNYKQPNETGGVLLGSIFLNAKTIVITDILDAPPDSIETPTEFILGTKGLEKQIKDIERKTKGKVTYLGTWHSHPFGGGASNTDKKTSAKLLFVRNYEPTVCLIWTPTEVLEV